MENKWIILMQLGNAAVPAWFTSDDKNRKDVPVLFDTQKEAVEKVLENQIDNLSRQLDEIREGFRELDDIDMEPDEWVEKCTVNDEGVIHAEDSQEVYNPKTFVR